MFASEPTVVDKQRVKKVYSLFVALLVQCVILGLAAFVAVMPAKKEEPEIVAQVIVPVEQTEIQPEQKQISKRSSQASTSGAASVIAKMLRAEAVARISIPTVEVISDGPVGLGEGELGSGFGSGRGGGMGDGTSFFGTKTVGNLAVIFDITGSMYGSVPVVVKEINKRFSTSQVVCVYGAIFKDVGEPKIIPYAKNREVHAEMKAWLKGDTKGKNAVFQKKMHSDLLSLKNCDSLVKGTQTLQSLGKAIEALLLQSGSRRPNTIFVFSDFMDGVDPGYMEKVQKLVKRTGTKVVFYHPTKFRRDKSHYDKFAKETRGEVKEQL